MAKAKKKKRATKKASRVIEIDIWDADSIRRGLTRFIDEKIAMPWALCFGLPPALVRYDIFMKKQLGLVDPTLGGFSSTEGGAKIQWGWKAEIPQASGSMSLSGISETEKKARGMVDDWLKSQGYTLLED